jgi:peptidoglycan/xylan/chitin deacetylase (PgdA/CDA1 family)
MDYLAGHGYHPVTMAEIYAALSGDGRLPSRPVAITFDDGGLDGYAVALPILRAHGFRATFFVITGYVGNGSCMTWDQLREMSAAGMAIESHTFAHPDLRRVDAARLANELRRSRDAIASELGVDARFLSYPNGRYDQDVQDAVASAGYLAAVTTRPPGLLGASISSYSWPRTGIAPGESLARFAAVLRGPRLGIGR